MTSLLRMTEDALELAAYVDDYASAHDGDVSDIDAALSERLQGLEDDRALKLETIGHCLAEWTARAKVRLDEARRLMDAARADRARAERLEAYVLFCLQKLGLKVAASASYEYRVARNGGLLPIEVTVPAEQLPARFVRVARAPDLGAIREAITAGESVPFAVVGERGVSLRVR